MKERRFYLHLRIITPRGEQVDSDVFEVTYPSHDGMCGVLSMHAPMLTKLGMGILTYRDLDNNPCGVFIEDGFARVSDNEVRIIARNAVTMDHANRVVAQKELRQAEVMAAKGITEIEARHKAIQRAKCLIKLSDSKN